MCVCEREQILGGRLGYFLFFSARGVCNSSRGSQAQGHSRKTSENPADPRRDPAEPSERPRRALSETPAEPSERQISSESLAEGCAPRMVTLRNFRRVRPMGPGGLGGGSVFFIENPRRGGVSPEREGPRAREGVCGELRNLGGGGLNIFFRGRNVHREF